METPQETSVSKQNRRGKRRGRRYCKRHGLEYVPLYNPPRTVPKVTYDYTFTVEVGL